MFPYLKPNVALKSINYLCSCANLRKLSVVSYDNDHITVDLGIDTPNPISFLTIFLRDACGSPESINESSRQKSFTTAQIARNLGVVEPPIVSLIGNEPHLEVIWRNGNGSVSKSTYSESELIKYSSLKRRMVGKFFRQEQQYWNKPALLQDMKSLNVDYFAYMTGDETFKNVINVINKFGICFINGIEDPLQNPQTQTLTDANWALWPVAKLAKRFGYIKETFYGKLFNVENEKNAKNIANTDVFLPLHMDLCYYESPPGLQLLHFIQNSTNGGENVFADSFLGAQHIKSTDPEAYDALKKVPITFQYDNNNEYYYYLRPLIVEDQFLRCPETGEAQIKEVNYSPPFQGPMEYHITREEEPELFESFIRGMIAFEDFVNDPINQYVVKIPEKSCVIFDNRRVLHSRLQFSDDNGGDRWLMGCYVDGDSFRSKLRTYNRDQKFV